MDTCKSCLKRDTCNKICPDIDILLNGTNTDIKSSYRVLSFENEALEYYYSLTNQNEITINERVVELKRLLTKFFKKLTKRQKKCISLYFGMFGNESHTQNEIAYILKIKRHTVSYHISMGKKKLQKLIEKNQNTRLFL